MLVFEQMTLTSEPLKPLSSITTDIHRSAWILKPHMGK